MSTLPTPVLAIKGAICFTCYTERKLSACGRCKRVSYCSTECQKKDWLRGHKKLCPILREITSGIDPEPIPPQTWEQYRQGLWALIDAFRNTNPPENSHNHSNVNDERIIQYQPYCTSCYRSKAQLPSNTQKFTFCPTCKIAAHCTSCTLPPHNCSSLQEVMIADLFSTAHYNETSEPFIHMPTGAPRSTYLPLSTAESWYDYYTKISDKGMVKGLLSPNLKPLAGNDEMAAAMRAATDKMSMMLTIIAGLETVYPSISTMETITLHLIGANKKELDALMLFEEILHLLPALKEIHCVFIGLEMPRPMEGTEGNIVLDCCPECTKLSKIRSLEMYKGAYHDFLSSQTYSKPNLAVSFQTGHSQEAVSDWRPTIEYLVKEAEHATVFTTFNEKELVEEMAILKGLGARFLIEGQMNKWRGLRPLLEVMEDVEWSIYFNHQFWYVLQGQGVKK